MNEAAQKKRSAGGEAKKAGPEGRAARRMSKDKVREIFLGRLPTGGTAIEIGVWHGDFSGMILDLIKPEKLYLIDPWANVTDDSHSEAFVGRTEDDKMERIFAKVQKRYAPEIQSGRVEIIREWSVPALDGFKPESIDFAYVDGDHSYEGVKADLAALFPKMRLGGVMAFDDYHRRGWWGDGVIRGDQRVSRGLSRPVAHSCHRGRAACHRKDRAPETRRRLSMQVLVTTMKDEGPFMLEWVAHYLSIGFDHFIICTNDCVDGTDRIALRLEEMGLASHIDNPGPWKIGPQASAYEHAMAHPKLALAEWILVADADEFLNIKVGDGTLDALFEAAPDANLISVTWALFGHAGRVEFEDGFVTEQFTRCADPYQKWPSMCRGIKTLYRADAGFRTLSTHRPKGPARGWRKRLNWVDGDGDPMSDAFGAYGWQSLNTGQGFGNDLARMNHYAVRSIQSYLMKRLRGDVRSTAYHRKLEESGVQYWALHCWNGAEDHSILRRNARHRARFDALMADATLAELHAGAVAHHQARMAELCQTPAAQNFINTFRDYRGAFDWTPFHDVVTCADLALDANRLATEDYGERLSLARGQAARQARRSRRLPWFANLDTTGQTFATARQADEDVPETLRPFPAEAISDILPARPQSRPKRLVRREQMLRQVGKSGRVWAVLHSGDPTLFRAILDVAGPERLVVMNPWGFRADQFTIPISARRLDRDGIAEERAFHHILEEFRAEMLENRLILHRNDPYFALKTLPPEAFDAVFLSGSMAEAPTRKLLDRVFSRLAPGGVLILDSYHRRSRFGDGPQRALHGLLADHAGALRIKSIEGAHCAVERLAPLEASA